MMIFIKAFKQHVGDKKVCASLILSEDEGIVL